jgi:ArsR family transcriptional regulator
MKSVSSPVPVGVFRALGHPARLRMVQELGDGRERCVCELVALCGLGWSTVSRHLSVLREAGVIAQEKRGLQIYCHLALPCVARFIDCLEHPQRYPALQESCGCR